MLPILLVYLWLLALIQSHNGDISNSPCSLKNVKEEKRPEESQLELKESNLNIVIWANLTH